MAQGHQSSVPRADAAKVAWVIRLYLYVVFARQETKRSGKRLRTLLFGKPPTPSPSLPEDVGARAVLAADTASEVPAHPGSPVGGQKLERAKATGGHRPGTGRLGAAASAGATRVEGRHDERAVGQRCPVCGQGTL